MAQDDTTSTCAALAAQVHDFYETHPYPPPRDDVEAYRRNWNDGRRKADAYLLWPGQPYREDRTILVAGCGTVQAAHYAVRWPLSRVVGIDVSEHSIAFSRELKRKYALDNLELRRLEVERAADLHSTFDHVVCTGVLHHLPDPDTGLRALRDVLEPAGSLHLMVYAPYGRTGIYMLQEYCRRLGIAATQESIAGLASTLRAIPEDHPLVPLLRRSPDFATAAGLADALLHPNDRAYSVPALLDFLRGAGFTFGRWVRQAPYLPSCGAIASTPHASRLSTLPLEEQYAAMELFRGSMVRHHAIAYAAKTPPKAVDFETAAWLDYVPLRLPETIVVREKLPPGCVGVLINRNHTYNDLYLPIDAREDAWFASIDGRRSVRSIVGSGEASAARAFFRRLWEWDQVVYCS